MLWSWTHISLKMTNNWYDWVLKNCLHFMLRKFFVSYVTTGSRHGCRVREQQSNSWNRQTMVYVYLLVHNVCGCNMSRSRHLDKVMAYLSIGEGCRTIRFVICINVEYLWTQFRNSQQCCGIYRSFVSKGMTLSHRKRGHDISTMKDFEYIVSANITS